ncbi:hypothetical protein NPX13_g6526 [Xylaria arbuscula]|uniref:Uncharacterized protein n=1 Tax=Xylaria arbuscula TaxID=114810 RepID=A0A9W8TLB9_9PEZI|nr:hypothetical protein NPX13_g6526 [Xylaria arbuscula]
MGPSEGAPDCPFADWRSIFKWLANGKDFEGVRILIEDYDSYEPSPSPVVGLTIGLTNQLELVDVADEGFDGRYEENDWHRGGPAWAIPDFFELLKEQFRRLHFIPISPYKATSVFIKRSPEYEGLIPMLQGIYREHGWPDLERYDKQACLDAVQRALEERYPDEAGPIQRS